MTKELAINKLKGIYNILTSMSEAAPGSIIWSEHALVLLSDDLMECIEVLEQE